MQQGAAAAPPRSPGITVRGRGERFGGNPDCEEISTFGGLTRLEGLLVRMVGGRTEMFVLL